jgi:hypothetical protein
MGGFIKEGNPVDKNASSRRGFQKVQAPEEGAFTCSRGTNDADNLPFMDFGADIF